MKKLFLTMVTLFYACNLFATDPVKQVYRLYREFRQNAYDQVMYELRGGTLNPKDARKRFSELALAQRFNRPVFFNSSVYSGDTSDELLLSVHNSFKNWDEEGLPADDAYRTTDINMAMHNFLCDNNDKSNSFVSDHADSGNKSSQELLAALKNVYLTDYPSGKTYNQNRVNIWRNTNCHYYNSENYIHSLIRAAQAAADTSGVQAWDTWKTEMLIKINDENLERFGRDELNAKGMVEMKLLCSVLEDEEKENSVIMSIDGYDPFVLSQYIAEPLTGLTIDVENAKTEALISNVTIDVPANYDGNITKEILFTIENRNEQAHFSAANGTVSLDFGFVPGQTRTYTYSCEEYVVAPKRECAYQPEQIIECPFNMPSASKECIDFIWQGTECDDSVECEEGKDFTDDSEGITYECRDGKWKYFEKQVNCKKYDYEGKEYISDTATVNWNESEQRWNDAPECDWECKDHYDLNNGGECTAATRKAYCDDSNKKLPPHAHWKQEKITQTYTASEDAFLPTLEQECSWSCDRGYYVTRLPVYGGVYPNLYIKYWSTTCVRLRIPPLESYPTIKTTGFRP